MSNNTRGVPAKPASLTRPPGRGPMETLMPSAGKSPVGSALENWYSKLSANPARLPNSGSTSVPCWSFASGVRRKLPLSSTPAPNAVTPPRPVEKSFV